MPHCAFAMTVCHQQPACVMHGRQQNGRPGVAAGQRHACLHIMLRLATLPMPSHVDAQHAVGVHLGEELVFGTAMTKARIACVARVPLGQLGVCLDLLGGNLRIAHKALSPSSAATRPGASS